MQDFLNSKRNPPFSLKRQDSLDGRPINFMQSPKPTSGYEDRANGMNMDKYFTRKSDNGNPMAPSNVSERNNEDSYSLNFRQPQNSSRYQGQNQGLHLQRQAFSPY